MFRAVTKSDDDIRNAPNSLRLTFDLRIVARSFNRTAVVCLIHGDSVGEVADACFCNLLQTSVYAVVVRQVTTWRVTATLVHFRLIISGLTLSFVKRILPRRLASPPVAPSRAELTNLLIRRTVRIAVDLRETLISVL